MKKVLCYLLVFVLLTITAASVLAAATYTVQRGDTMAKIARAHGITAQQLAEENGLKKPRPVKPGQVLNLPEGARPALAVDTAALKGTSLTIATTTSTNDTGLLDVLVPAFDKKYGTKTKWVSVGSGEAIAMGERGDADVLLVHSRAAEDEFIAKGYGINRRDVMYNYYYIVGPKSDPAKVSGMKLAKDAFAAIAKSESPFLSRADKSGTNTKELSIWKSAGLSPSGSKDKWYKETGLGMLDLLNMANEMEGYTLTDSGTWGAAQGKVNGLKIVLKGDSALFNPYGVIVVNPEKYSNLNSNAAQAFANFITSSEGQQIIKKYKKNGQQLFVPDAK